MKIKAINTKYKGYTFRSRIEARWAVFFDCCGIKYEYEKEGYDLGEGVLYLPDFYLPDLDMFVEIKGKEIIEDDNIKLNKLCLKSKKRVLLLCGEIPYVGYGSSVFDYSYDKHGQTFVIYNCYNTNYEDEKNPNWLVGNDYPYLFCECPDCGKVGVEFDGRSDRLKCKSKGCDLHSNNGDKGYNYSTKKIDLAFRTARGYRFEFGDK